MATKAGDLGWWMSQLSSGGATELLEPVEEALEGAQGILKDLEFGAIGTAC